MNEQYLAVKEGDIGFRVYDNGKPIADFSSSELVDEYVNFKNHRATMERIIESKLNPPDTQYQKDCNLAQEYSAFNRHFS